MAKKRGALLLLTCTIALAAIEPAHAAIKAGDLCPKLGVTTGPLMCSSVKGALQWKVVRKSQAITFTQPTEIASNQKSFTLVAASNSKLAVTARSLTSGICTTNGLKVAITGSPGICRLSLGQPGNPFYLAAPTQRVEFVVSGINLIRFEMPGALLLSQSTYTLTGTSTSGLPLSYSSATPLVCTTTESLLTLLSAGKCILTASQAGAGFYPVAQDVIDTIEISAARVSADLPDQVSGFQVKAIYVVPSDGVDHFYDTNGVIAGVLKAGNDYLQQELNLTLPIDSTSSGYDITFLQSSKPASYFLTSSGAYRSLLQESGLLNLPSANRKDFIFFVDTPTVIASTYCGEAGTPGISAVVAIGLEECGKRTSFFENYASQTWVHEIFHNFGVVHVPIACDLMFGGQSADGLACPATQRASVDLNRNLYLGTKKYGEDILTLRVWNTYTDRQDMKADCWIPSKDITRTDKVNFALCPTGTQAIGPLSFCWSQISSASLEENVDGAWVSLGAANHSNSPWGSRIDWSCNDPGYSAPWKSLTVLTPGAHHYRWIVNGNVSEEFNIIWQS